MKIIKLPILAIIALLLAGGASAQSAPSPMNTKIEKPSYYRFSVDSNLVGYSVRINGLEIDLYKGGSSRSSSSEINVWLFPGANEISIRVFWPKEISYVAGKGYFKASLDLEKIITQDPYKEEKIQLLSFEWPAAGVPETYPFDIKKQFTPEAFPPVLMEKAQTLVLEKGNPFDTLPAADQKSILDIVSAFEQALSEKDVDKIYALQKLKYQDVALARYSDEEEYKKAIMEQLNWLKTRKDIKVVPPKGDYEFILSAQNRIVRVAQGPVGNPQPAVTLLDKDGDKESAIKFDLYFCKIDGKWVLIR